jgi:hypothetical protein
MQMKNNPLVIVAILALSLGCNMFSGGGNASNSAVNAPQAATNSTPAAQATLKRPTRADLAGRWGVNRDTKDHVIEFREDGTGTINTGREREDAGEAGFHVDVQRRHGYVRHQEPRARHKNGRREHVQRARETDRRRRKTADRFQPLHAQPRRRYVGEEIVIRVR